MTDFNSLDVMELAEEVAAGRLGAADAEQRVRSSLSHDQKRADGAVRELHSLIAAARAVRAHSSATREALGMDPTRVGAAASASAVVQALPVGGSVRRRSNRGSGTRPPQRIGLLVAAALLIGTGVLASSLIGSKPPSPIPTPSQFPVALASPTPSAQASVKPSAQPTTSPPPSAAPNASAPRLALWHQTAADRISLEVWSLARPEPARLVDLDTWADPDASAGAVINRQVLVNHQASLVAFAETDPQAKTRVRVFTKAGTVVWTQTSPNGIPALAWSADGSQLAVAYVPQPWIVVTFQASGSADATTYRLVGADVPLQLLGFSADGNSLLAYDGSGEAAPWERPYSINLARGVPTGMSAFGGGQKGIAPANAATLAGRVDPVTGRVLDSGDLSGRQANWSLPKGKITTELGLPVSNDKVSTQTRWTDDGSIVVLQVSRDTQPPSNTQQDPVVELIRKPVAGSKPEKVADVTWSYRGPEGTRCRAVLLDARDGYALVGLSKIPATDAAWLGFDELNLINLRTAGGGLLSLDGLGHFDMHPAGLID